MCSIFGSLRLKKESICKEDFVDNCLLMMRHRGPDNESIVEIDDIYRVGHQRLSIIDIETNQTNHL